jgi:toxin CcdB
MARFDVFRFPSTSNQLVVDVQADLLDGLTTRIVVPLLPIGSIPVALNRLNPKFEVDSKTYVFAIQYIASVPTGSLKMPISNLQNQADAIIASMDMIFQGF